MTLLRGHFPFWRRFSLSLEKKKINKNKNKNGEGEGEENPMNDQLLCCVVWSPHPRYSGRNGRGGTAAADEGGENVVDQFRRLCVHFFFFFSTSAHTHTHREYRSCSNRTLPIFFLCPFFHERFRVKKKKKVDIVRLLRLSSFLVHRIHAGTPDEGRDSVQCSAMNIERRFL